MPILSREFIVVEHIITVYYYYCKYINEMEKIQCKVYYSNVVCKNLSKYNKYGIITNCIVLI